MDILRPRHQALIAFVFVSTLFSSAPAWSEVQRVKYQAQGNYLVVEVLSDDLVHLEYGTGAGPGTDHPIATSDMVCRAEDQLPATVCQTVHEGPTSFANDGAGHLETPELRLQVDPATLLVTLIDRSKHDLLLTTLRPESLNQPGKALVGTRTADLDVYGLGQEFLEPGNPDLEWDGRIRQGGPFGNVMAGFNGGANGNTHIPIIYAVNGPTFENYALFLDNIYRHRWDFTGSTQWRVEVTDGPLRLFLMTGPDLRDLRRDYMNLVGHPEVPPRKMFGLWVSEYGYDDWTELESKLDTLRTHAFPLDGFVLDLQWFGGVAPDSDDTRMGSLTFDESHFPDPAGTIAHLADDQGVGIMLIEEAYVGRNLPEHSDLASRGCLARACPGCTEPAYIASNPWWGKGGMIDYTSDDCGAEIHDRKRQNLIADGVIGHWTDLGEPEMYDPGAGYAAGAHADAHNIFNLRWIRSIYEGYRRHGVERRPFMMSRSGAAGIERFGAAMWSGDIGSKFGNLAAHLANHMHMSFSGIDYYGSDIGGFHRGDIQNDQARKNDLYTRWYAAGMMLGIPGRPHTENLCNCKETAPDRIGDLASNLANTRLRYRLVPYLYSLAHRAYRFGEAVMPPLVMDYQTDPQVRGMGHETLIGPDLLVSLVSVPDTTQQDVYLPAGDWVDWHSQRRITSPGAVIPGVALFRDGLFRLPLFAREGAVIPVMRVDDQTMNALGRRKDGTLDQNLRVRAFSFGSGHDGSHAFTLYEDDGITTAYQQGAVRTTGITQTRSGARVTLELAAASGRYDGAPDNRDNVVELVADGRAAAATLNGEPLPELASMAAFDAGDPGWIDTGSGLVLIRSGVLPVSQVKTFELTLQAPQCTSRFESVSIPGAGNGWNPADPQRTLARTDCDGKVWSGRVSLCNEPYKFAADGAWTVNWGCDGHQDGPNCPPQPAGLYQVRFDEEDPAHPLFERVGDAPACAAASARFVCENGNTSWGTSVYVVGNIAELGAWDPARAVPLQPDGPYPTWTGTLADLPSGADIQWKCIKRLESDDQHVVEWQPGGNNHFDPAAQSQVGRF